MKLEGDPEEPEEQVVRPSEVGERRRPGMDPVDDAREADAGSSVRRGLRGGEPRSRRERKPWGRPLVPAR